MLYREQVLASRRSGSFGSIVNHTNFSSDYIYLSNAGDNLTYPLGRWSLNQIIYNGKSYIITPKGSVQDKFVLQDIGYDKDLNFPDESGEILTTFIDPSDTSKTIYVGGTFEFTDKNGVTAKNIAKFVPASSKL